MNRRLAITRVAQVMGGTLSTPLVFTILEGCKSATDKMAADAFKAFTKEQLNLVSEVAEVIIPKTATPGAKDAKVGEFIQTMIRDCYLPDDQDSFLKGLTDLEKKGFLTATSEERIKLLTEEEKAAKERDKKIQEEKALATAKKETSSGAEKKETDQKTDEEERYQEAGTIFKEPTKSFFNMAKELTLLGYFTSEQGATQALDYVPIPGRYESCIDLKADTKAYAL